MTTEDQMKAIKFFVSAYDELVLLCNNNSLDNYKVNQISRILRQFLFDQYSIVANVARIVSVSGSRRLKFICCPYKPRLEVGLEFGGIYDGFYPLDDAPFRQDVVTLSLNQLGSQVLIEYKGKPYTLKQLVKYIANKEGGIHFDQKNLDIDELTLKDLQDFMAVGGHAALTRTLLAVGLVLIDGLTDIASKAKENI